MNFSKSSVHLFHLLTGPNLSESEYTSHNKTFAVMCREYHRLQSDGQASGFTLTPVMGESQKGQRCGITFGTRVKLGPGGACHLLQWMGTDTSESDCMQQVGRNRLFDLSVAATDKRKLSRDACKECDTSDLIISSGVRSTPGL
jgi:hypothetical protein